MSVGEHFTHGIEHSDEDAARWAATRLDATGVAFTPIQGATNSFSWTPERADRWTATLTWTDKDGKVHVVTYPMERLGP